MNKQLLETIKALVNIKGAKFISLTYLSKGTSELARHNLLLGVRLEKAYKRDLALYSRKLSKLEGVTKIACQELIESINESLAVGIGNNSACTTKDSFEYLGHGLKLHLESGDIHLSGFSQSKIKVCQSCNHEQKHGETCDSCKVSLGTYKQVKSSEKTLAKNKLRKLGKLGRFRQFVLKADELKGIRLNGKTLEIS